MYCAVAAGCQRKHRPLHLVFVKLVYERGGMGRICVPLCDVCKTFGCVCSLYVCSICSHTVLCLVLRDFILCNLFVLTVFFEAKKRS